MYDALCPHGSHAHGLKKVILAAQTVLVLLPEEVIG